MAAILPLEGTLKLPYLLSLAPKHTGRKFALTQGSEKKRKWSKNIRVNELAIE